MFYWHEPWLTKKLSDDEITLVEQIYSDPNQFHYEFGACYLEQVIEAEDNKKNRILEPIITCSVEPC